tara:strand:+ start:3001 stop:3294 length:294 start_codon:yes stop_codon:yes gene_type:complete
MSKDYDVSADIERAGGKENWENEARIADLTMTIDGKQMILDDWEKLLAGAYWLLNNFGRSDFLQLVNKWKKSYLEWYDNEEAVDRIIQQMIDKKRGK